MNMSPREQTAAEAALIKNLIETIVVPEVTRPMEAIGWGHGTPPPPMYNTDNPVVPGNTTTPAPALAPVTDGQPAPVPVSAVAPVTGEPNKDMLSNRALAILESAKDPKTGLYGGKYKTLEEYVNGIGHVVQMSKTAFSRVDAAEQEAQRLRNELAVARQTPAASAAAPVNSSSLPVPQTVTTVSSSKLDAVLSRLKSEGGILDEENLGALIEGVSELASLKASAVADERLTAREAAQRAEDEKWKAVDAHMEQVAPESLQYSQEIGLFVRTNPLASAAVAALVRQGNLNEATELSWSLFQMAHQGMTKPEIVAATEAETVRLEAGDQVRREALDEARKAAGVASSSASGVHESPVIAGPSQDEIDQAAAEMRAGNGTRWRALTIGRGLTDPIFDR